MKKLILMGLFTLLCIGSKAQGSLEVSGSPYYYEDVIREDSISAHDLYSKGLEWFANTFNDSKAVIQIQDPVGLVIVGKGKSLSNKNSFGARYYVDYTVKLEFKDGKVRYSLYDFSSEYYGTIKDGKITKYQIFLGHGEMNRIYKNLQLECGNVNDVLSTTLRQGLKKSINW